MAQVCHTNVRTRMRHADVEPDIGFVPGLVVNDNTTCDCGGHLVMIGTAGGVEVHECHNCRCQYKALERAGRGERKYSFKYMEF